MEISLKKKKKHVVPQLQTNITMGKKATFLKEISVIFHAVCPRAYPHMKSTLLVCLLGKVVSLKLQEIYPLSHLQKEPTLLLCWIEQG